LGQGTGDRDGLGDCHVPHSQPHCPFLEMPLQCAEPRPCQQPLVGGSEQQQSPAWLCPGIPWPPMLGGRAGACTTRPLVPGTWPYLLLPTGSRSHGWSCPCWTDGCLLLVTCRGPARCCRCSLSPRAAVCACCSRPVAVPWVTAGTTSSNCC